ncbi:hypothetical protein [Staphylococcus delphini]|uniref:hypothetical protein n=2 Tax=Staphylococcus TaxID=1279 RepID=UPI001F203A27|nr:hypothetical protein [Staphylococcus delphini]
MVLDAKKWYDELIKRSKERDDLKRKLDDVVDMVNAYITAAKAYSGESTYNLLENELKRILEGERMTVLYVLTLLLSGAVFSDYVRLRKENKKLGYNVSVLSEQIMKDYGEEYVKSIIKF